MTPTATLDSQPVLAATDQLLATNVVLVEWLVKRQQQLSLQQRLIEQQQQQIAAQQQEIEQLKEERDKLKTGIFCRICLGGSHFSGKFS